MFLNLGKLSSQFCFLIQKLLNCAKKIEAINLKNKEDDAANSSDTEVFDI